MTLFSGQIRTTLAGGCWYEYRRNWLPEPAAAFEALRRDLQWQQYHTRIEGVGEVPYPRLESWYVVGDPVNYRYGGVDHHSRPLVHPDLYRTLRRLRDQEQLAPVPYGYNAVFANLYRTGADSIGWHSDDEPALGPVEDVQIACVSLGVPRTLELRRTTDAPAAALRIVLEPGSLFTMGPGLQAGWLHRVPKEPEVEGERIALTFRRVYS